MIEALKARVNADEVLVRRGRGMPVRAITGPDVLAVGPAEPSVRGPFAWCSDGRYRSPPTSSTVVESGVGFVSEIVGSR